MNGIEVIIGLLRCIISNHLFWRALEAHAFAAARAQHLVAAVYLDDWHAAVGIGALPDAVFDHVLHKVGIGLANLDGLIAGEAGMYDFLGNMIRTLHLLQYDSLQVSQL